MSAPLSPFYRAGELVFISGQVGSDIETKVIPEDFESQALNVFRNLEQVLASAEVDKSQIVKTTVFLTDMSFYSKMNELYVEFFGDHKPARSAIGVAALPKFPGDPRVFIEIEAVAYISS